MAVEIGKFRVEFHATHHITYQWGAVITWPDGKKSYGEYKSVGEVMNKVRKLAKENTNRSHRYL